MYIYKMPGLLSVAVATVLVTGGCATNKHVREAIAPVQNQLNTVGKQSNENKNAIGDLDRQVAVADEKATDAGKRAKDAADAALKAGDAASKANDSALSAGQRADGANTLAQQTGTRLQTLDQTVQNLDNYQLKDTQKIMFRLGASELTKEAKTELDAAIQNLTGMKHYVLEVEGYTDRTGDKNYNLTLSERRADAVVRYFTAHNVPLRKIHKIGIGSELVGADNSTRAARKENRRVDVRVFALDAGAGKLQSASSSNLSPQQ